MGNVLISLDEDYEALLRRFARERHGARKGAISATVEEALSALSFKEDKEKARKLMFEEMDRGVHLGLKGKIYNKRDDIYD